ncbi:MAG: hypothetical protein M1375_03315 [Candidatus Thermoplasmatota archaeon]|nr:hypothetical protein [Candidatus Thermoplasmatota archaeon]MCL5790984.1 hypothetical protein [Candidatus Thermoplasmatota archaeon]
MTSIRRIVDETLMDETIRKFSSRRWFFVRPEDIISAGMETSYPEEAEDGDPLIMLIYIETVDGTKYMNLALTLHQDTRGKFHFTDSIEDGRFPNLLSRMLHDSGKFEIQNPVSRLREAIERKEEFRSLKLEQSNSSFRIGEEIIGKFFRTPSGTDNPDYKLPVLIRKYSDFRGVPENLGTIIYHGSMDLCICVFSSYVKNYGDYWKYLFESSRVRENGEFLIEARSEAERIGVAVADLHLAMSAIGENNYRSEPFNDSDYERMKRQDRNLITEFRRLLSSPYGVVYRDVATIIDTFSTLNLSQIGEMKQPIHGDLHLGQILKTDGGPVIIDFEGEPMASMEDRISKGSPMKDLAGMTRSWNYIWHFILGQGELPDRISEEFRNITLTSYTDEIKRSGHRMNDLWKKTLSFFETEKAIYEAVYEWNNRPEMLWIPMQFLRNSLKIH